MSTVESRPAFEPGTPLAVFVMGVSGSGKSTVAAQVAGRLGIPYLDADDLHPPENVAKMHAGTPLNDDDRWPWLDKVGAVLRDAARQRGGAVMACSALKRIYRDRLRASTGGLGHARFVFLDASFAVIHERLAARIHHFMPETLLRSQFDTLERPAAAETDVLTVSADQDPQALVTAIADWLENDAG